MIVVKVFKGDDYIDQFTARSYVVDRDIEFFTDRHGNTSAIAHGTFVEFKDTESFPLDVFYGKAGGPETRRLLVEVDGVTTEFGVAGLEEYDSRGYVRLWVS